MKFFDTKTRKIEEFKPLKQNEVKIYYCGPTVYNYAHIWNLKTHVVEDIVIKTLSFLGYNVKTTMNITDVDDKTIRDSRKVWENLKSFTEKYTKKFLNDTRKLWIKDADKIVPITTVIPEMVRMINTMLKRGVAYISDDGSIYFKISKYKKYGQFANLDMENLKTSVRIDNDEYDKESASDFALWKWWTEADGVNFWEEEFEINGEKKVVKWRPGWHIECSACAMKHLWQQIDIHMWWEDLIFPHHQNEIAQTEACTRKEFSKYWIHSGHLMVDGKKMSKSLWNFYTLRDIEKKFSEIPKDILYRAIRLSFLNGKYRDSIEFNFWKLEQFFNTIKKIDATLKNIKDYQQREFEIEWVSRNFREYLQEIVSRYIEKLEDDFSMPEALAIFYEFMKFVNTGIKDESFSKEEGGSIIDMFKTFDEVLGIMSFDILEKKQEEIPKEILEKLEERNIAKKEKNFELADKLRDELNKKWYIIIDTRDGSRVEKK